MKKCGNCEWHGDDGRCKNPDAMMEGCVMNDMSWCCKYKRKKPQEVQDGPIITPCRGCSDYDGYGGCKSKGGCERAKKEVQE